MVLLQQFRTCNRFIIPLLFLALTFFGCAQLPTVRMTPAAAPAAINVAGARWVTVEGANGRKFITAILRPQGVGPFPVVVVLHGSIGLDERFVKVAEEVAHAGFLVVIGCWQAGEARTPGNALCSEATPQAEWVADPAANSGKELIAVAKALPDAIPDRIGLYGMSRGGHAALWAAATGAGVRALVLDAPAHRPAINPMPPSTLEIVGKVSVPILMLHGTADKVIPVEQSREYERAARALGKTIEVVYFDGVGHTVSVLPESQAEARKRAIAFLRENL